MTDFKILKTAFKISDLERQMEEMDFHIFHLKTEHEIFTHEDELEDIKAQNDCIIDDIEENEEYATKQTEIEILKEEHGITVVEEEHERLYEHLMDGKKYLDRLMEDEFNLMADMLANFHF